MILAKTGNEAIAYAMKQINPDVVAAYPITPSTEVVQIFSQYVADGEVDTEFVPAESEHSALSACVGAALAGGRVLTATASQGLALMHEILYIASGFRQPIVMALVNRTLSAPINIHCDHSDTMGSRDSGWLQIYCANSQEAYDSLIQAVKIAEQINLPVLITADAFILSHCMERIETLSDREVKEYLGERNPSYSILDVDNPITVGALDLQDYFFEHKRSQIEAMNNALPVVEKVIKEYAEKFKRYYPVVEDYRTQDAEVAIVVAGSTADTLKEVVDILRERGEKVGLVRIRLFRPFPSELLKKSLGKFKAVAVLDRCDSLSGCGGPMFCEIRSALYEMSPRPIIVNYVYGLGGREVEIEDFMRVYKDLGKIKDTGKYEKLINYLGVRGEE